MSQSDTAQPGPNETLRKHCPNCGRTTNWTAAVSVIVVKMELRSEPYPLIPSEHYRLCRECRGDFDFVDKATAAHAEMRASGAWQEALIVFADFEGHKVNNAVRGGAVQRGMACA